jgi:hypothetical protein
MLGFGLLRRVRELEEQVANLERRLCRAACLQWQQEEELDDLLAEVGRLHAALKVGGLDPSRPGEDSAPEGSRPSAGMAQQAGERTELDDLLESAEPRELRDWP